MRKSLTLLAVLLCLVAGAWAQATDAPRSSNGPWTLEGVDATNSQYVYIRVTMAGVVFTVTDGDWKVGDATPVLPANRWYAFPQNAYESASATNQTGTFQPSYATGGLYAAATSHDCPYLWNQGGVALDFLLGISDAGGWNYESQGSSNRFPASGVGHSGSYVNAFQVRAIFLDGQQQANTANFTATAAGEAQFKNPKIGTWPLLGLLAGDARLRNTDVVYTTAMLSAGGNTTANYSWSTPGMIYPWAEATTFRFNPDVIGGFVATCTDKGLGVPPNEKTTMVLQLLTPRKTEAGNRTGARTVRQLGSKP